MAPLEHPAVQRSRPEDSEHLAFGALGKNEVPFDKDDGSSKGATCLICGTGKIDLPHFSEPGHLQQRARICQDYVSYWQPLTASDGRPYYYDHVSHTWSFAEPYRTVVPRSCAEAQPEDAKAGAEEKRRLMQRLHRVLQFASGRVEPAANGKAGTGATPSGQGWVPVTEPRPGFQCVYCQQVFSDEWAVQQHIAAKSGKQNHPWTPDAWPAQTPAQPGPPAALPAAAPRATAPAARLSAEEDVQECESDGNKYWYNPRTLATDWTREGLVAKNRKFYAHVEPAAADGRRWWRWLGPTGTKHKEWELEALYAWAVRQEAVPLS